MYCASKHAVRAITQSLRAETISVPIKVTEIDPGLVKTEFSVIRFGGNIERADKVYEGIVSSRSPHKRTIICMRVFWGQACF